MNANSKRRQGIGKKQLKGTLGPVVVSVLLCLKTLSFTDNVQASGTTTLKTINSVRYTLAEKKGNILLVFMAKSGPILCNSIFKLLKIAPEINLVLNGKKLGSFCSDEIIRVTPRTGINVLKIFGQNGRLIGHYQFTALRASGINTKTLALIEWEDPSQGRLVNVGGFLDENLDTGLFLGWVPELHQFFDILRGTPVKIRRPLNTRNWTTTKSRSAIDKSEAYNSKTTESSEYVSEFEAKISDKAVESTAESEATFAEKPYKVEIEEQGNLKSNVATDRRSMY